MTINLLRFNVAAVLFLLISCGKSTPELKSIDLVRWKSDPNGCSGVRTQMIDAWKDEKKNLLSLNEMEIVDVLGKPDQEELYKRNQKFYRYFLQPGPTCSTPEADPKMLVIRFNAVGLAKEISIE